MSPDNSVRHIARIVTENAQFTEESVYAAMAAANVPDREADIAYKFTQAAWGRLLLDGLGIRFADDYYWLDANGDVVESGKLVEEPHFIVATRLGRQHGSQAGFKRLAVMSAEVLAVNDSLNAGSRPENLVTAPLVLFSEVPTEAGMHNAHQFLSEMLSRSKLGSTDLANTGPSGQPHDQPLARTDPAEKRSWFQKLFGHGSQ